MSNTYLIAVDAVTAAAQPGIGVGFVIAAQGKDRVSQPGFAPFDSRREALISTLSCAIRHLAPSLEHGDRIEVQICTDPDPLLKSPDPDLKTALAGLDSALEAVIFSGAEIFFSKADAREAPCLAEATQQAAVGLLCCGHASAA